VSATSPRYARRLAAAEWLAVALGTLALACQLATPDSRIGDDDFQVFYAGAAAIAAGQSPYVATSSARRGSRSPSRR
jgi:hypothetical protein